MKYSILVPVYNVQMYLRQCLDSLVQQTYKDFEVILADDGSTDSSGQICDEYAQRYPELFRVFHKKNEGLLLTRRFSLQQAKGEYILFVDSDDYVVPELLETVDKAFGQYACDMVLFNYFRFTQGGEELWSPRIPLESGTVFEGSAKQELYRQFVLKNLFVNMWIKAIRRDRVDKDADYSDKNVAMCEDVVQSLPLLDRCERVVYIDEVLYYYRKNAGSMTLSYKDRDFGDYITSLCQTGKYMELWQFTEEERQAYYTNRLYFFYELLRNVKMAQPEKYLDLVNNILGSSVLQNAFKETDVKFLPARVCSRVNAFRKSFLRGSVRGINAVIFWSNIGKGVKSYAGKVFKA